MSSHRLELSGIDPSLPAYSIGTVAADTGLSTSTIRSWERLGLVNPRRTEGGHRRFSRNDVVRLLMIRDLLDEGYALSAVPPILSAKEQGSLEEKLRALRRATRNSGSTSGIKA